ncbi:hypothetical protein GGR58DRAFT_480213 [Xylaria digitata]|nr:hypothetical protein GGR58DRAFT_480213 [Xylaria digitata]
MPRAQKSNEDEELPRTLTRVDSIRTTSQFQMTVSSTFTESIPKIKFTNDSQNNRDSYREQPKKSSFLVRKKLERIHDELAEELFTGSGDGVSIFEEYDKRDGDILTSPSVNENSVFHKVLDHTQYLILYDERKELVHSVPPVVREFLECLVIKHHHLLDQANDKGARPLDTAALKVKPVVFLIADLIFSDDKISELPAKVCPAKVKARPTDVCRLQLPKSVRLMFASEKGRNPPEASAPNMCLHDTVDVKKVEQWNSELKKTVMSVLQPRSIPGVPTSTGTILHALLEENCFTNEGSGTKAASFHRLIQLCSKETLLSTDTKGLCPLHKAVKLYEKSGIDFDGLHDVINSLVKQCPSSIYKGINDTIEGTPYSMLKKIEPGQQRDKAGSLNKTLKLLKHTCIGTTGQDRDKKLIHLYGGLKNAKNIYLDMAFPDVINRDFVDEMSNTVQFRFETALEYVSLRRDLPTANAGSALAQGAKKQERNPYRGVFEWLHKERDVEKIFSIIVEDMDPDPHTDESILAALKPFKIEKWDWRKFDICSQTILDAAPDLRELHLQCSGNNAVLRSWSCKHGLQQLQKLKSVTVTMHPDLRETKERCKKDFDDFSRAICRRRPDLKNNIHIKWAGEHHSQSVDSRITGASHGSNQSDQIAWVQTMKPFIDFVHALKETEIEPRDLDKKVYVNIALIDDGVSSTAKNIPILANGYSWHGQRSPDSPFRDYFTGPSRHGTQMAQCIYQVCPMAQLYVARMDDSSRLEKFTVDSAIKAVKWATDMGVDIISMSWTFKIDPAKPEEAKEFEEAIQNAWNKGIILLNSMNDKEMTLLNEWYPLSLKEVIRVGSATKWGEKAEQNRRGSANYLFPGEEITLGPTSDVANSDGSGGEKEVANGSSLSTAFAAGLMGLIIYASRALRHLDEGLGQWDMKKLEKVTSRESTERVFKVLGGKPHEINAVDLFVELGSNFPKDPERDADDQGRIPVLKSFITKLLL